MRLSVNENTGELYISAENIAAFARHKNASSSRMGFSLVADDGKSEAASVRYDVLTAVPVTIGPFSCGIFSTIDAVFYRGETVVSEKRTVVRRPLARVDLLDEPSVLAEAMVNAYLVAETENAESVTVRVCFEEAKSHDTAVYESRFSRSVLKTVFDALLSRAAPFIEMEGERQTAGRRALAALRFPYSSVRDGQRDFMEELYRCIHKGRRLLVSAPTGIGKTMSGMYPSLRAIGAGRADRVFYFTAKTVTGNAALDAARTLGAQAKNLRCIRITAKERACPVRAADRDAVTNCRLCSFSGFYEGVSYEERRDAALLELLRGGRVYDTKEIAGAAEKHHLCPYELSLDVSEYCEMIVSDYGYLFDPRVCFRRYFEDSDHDERYVFLVDEAHNLPDRAREMYSASLCRCAVERFATEVLAAFPDDRALADACDAVRAMMDGIDALCAENAEVRDEDGVLSGCVLEKTVPDFVPAAAARLRAVCDEYLRRDYDRAMPLFGEMRASLLRLSDAVSMADEHFAFYGESANGETICRVMCLDPSAMLDRAMEKGVSTALFSATLSPMDYYADVCGAKDAVQLDLPSPYEEENLCLIAVDSVSTRFSERKNSAADVAELILTVTESRPGNYIVYFPSYAYMTAVCRQYLRLSPGGSTIMQKQGMSLGERDRFLRAFARAEATGESLVAFCVLGGIFSEGIDLRGERLIGSIIVGIGLPGLSSELNILTEYYDRTRESGRDYAYTYPAMNKILQAAGRVIRDENDRGVVVLIDDRYADPGIRRLFPAHWNRMQYTGDAYSLASVLERFWAKWE
ncbi:MAG: ATP-dependent DNA helicase [Clostridia bacterium]|nr:ATP-dependent DNA helicase [Clostridia bacterium]